MPKPQFEIKLKKEDIPPGEDLLIRVALGKLGLLLAAVNEQGDRILAGEHQLYVRLGVEVKLPEEE